MSLQFDVSTTDKVNVGSLGDYDPDGHTFFLWYYLSGLSNVRFLAAKAQAASPFDQATYGHIRANGQLRFDYRGTTNLDYRTATGFLTTGSWQFIAIAFDLTGSAGSRCLMWHGDLTTKAIAYTSWATATDGSGYSTAFHDEPLILGNRDTVEAEAPAGSIAYAAVFPSILTLAEVQALQYRPGLWCIKNPLGFWDLGLNGTTNVPDLSGNGYTGTTTGVALDTHVPLRQPWFMGGEFIPSAIVAGDTAGLRTLSLMGVGI